MSQTWLSSPKKIRWKSFNQMSTGVNQAKNLVRQSRNRAITRSDWQPGRDLAFKCCVTMKPRGLIAAQSRWRNAKLWWMEATSQLVRCWDRSRNWGAQIKRGFFFGRRLFFSFSCVKCLLATKQKVFILFRMTLMECNWPPGMTRRMAARWCQGDCRSRWT